MAPHMCKIQLIEQRKGLARRLGLKKSGAGESHRI
jgi:hypothetical protein